MLSIFKSTPVVFPIAELLQTDMHSHILPGIDDGAQDEDASLQLIRGLIALGFQRFIATPHIMSDHYPNTPQTIEASASRLKEALANANMDIEIAYAAEYMLDEAFEEKIHQEPLLKIGEDYVLVETMFMAEPSNFSSILFDLQTLNYQPVVAHPERYHYVFHNIHRAERMKDRGALLQINALSLLGYYGKHEKHTAIQLLEAGLVDFIGTDIHHEKHLKFFNHFSLDRKVIKLLENTPFKNQNVR
ncbi:histidinol phosphatase [Olivibacter sp. SDN3]|uniref:tyrosine-protein phosphatase n=1 Tax=Olivibacter sp. SDN3 TaxID=2764720 RepID=UPI0016515DC6|nr:CpsB/CapC family capsule biosynthesis tyrosine phosphatase [Olivibacter sp. SDN3]QNL51607.1 histidinol phosphatase [Olivibacter sp. SDN3]